MGRRARLARALGKGARGLRQWAAARTAGGQARIRRMAASSKGLGLGMKGGKWGLWAAAALAVVCLQAAAPGLAQAMALPAPSGDGASAFARSCGRVVLPSCACGCPLLTHSMDLITWTEPNQGRRRPPP